MHYYHWNLQHSLFHFFINCLSQIRGQNFIFLHDCVMYECSDRHFASFKSTEEQNMAYLFGIQRGNKVSLSFFFFFNIFLIKREGREDFFLFKLPLFLILLLFLRAFRTGEDHSFVPTKMRTSFTARILRHYCNAIIIIITISISPINLSMCF